jgi:hypothetical protein
MEPGAECYDVQNTMYFGESTAMCAVQNEVSTASGVTSLRLIIENIQLPKIPPVSLQSVASRNAFSCGQTSWAASAQLLQLPSHHRWQSFSKHSESGLSNERFDRYILYLAIF